MDMHLNWSSGEALCRGCLSLGRRMSIVANEDSRKLFCEFSAEMDLLIHPLILCWECGALLRKAEKFKAQIQKAHSNLVKQISNPTCLSTLQISEPSTIYEYKHVQSTPRALTFVKVEDDVFNDDFAGDDDVADTSNDKTEETAVRLDPSDGVDNTSGTRTDFTVQTPLDDFNESDDEPLEKKKKQVKPRGRRKKKDKAPPKESAEPRAPRGRREQPPGVVSNPRVARKLQQLRVQPSQLEMVVLSWTEVEEERQRALLSENYTRHEYRCHHCALGFNHRCKLDDHMQKHDPSSGTAECSVCHIFCKDSHALAAHRRRHRVRWRCRACGGRWSRAAVAADHVARAHGAPPPAHTCSVCGHSEQTLGKLRNHLKNHAERQKCELCGKTFRDKTSLRTHLFIHKGEKEYACSRCDKRFLFKRAMEIHLITHDAPAHLYCHQCDMNFKNRMSYNQHMKYSLKHIDPAKLKYACQLCDKKFLKATRLQEHNLAVHLKITPIQCTVPGCNFACSSRPVLRTHIRMLHRDARNQRNHVCDVCGKAYTTKSSLAGHLRTHTGERPFRCPRCPATFGHEASLYNHTKLVHLRDKSTRSRVNVTSEAETAMAPSIQNFWPLTVPTITLNTHIDQ